MRAEPSSRFVELVVVILLALAGISATVAVYEATQHRNASPWWTAAVAALILAVLVPLVFLVIHPLFSRQRDRSRQIAGASDADLPSPWVQPKALGEYLASINKTMEEHGFGRNASAAASGTEGPLAAEEVLARLKELNIRAHQLRGSVERSRIKISGGTPGFWRKTVPQRASALGDEIRSLVGTECVQYRNRLVTLNAERKILRPADGKWTKDGVVELLTRHIRSLEGIIAEMEGAKTPPPKRV